MASVNPHFIFPCGDISALTELLQRALSDPRKLARRGRASLGGCSLGQPERISAEFLLPWSELFHGTDQIEPFLRIRDSPALFGADTLLSNVMINPAWPRQIQPRLQRLIS